MVRLPLPSPKIESPANLKNHCSVGLLVPLLVITPRPLKPLPDTVTVLNGEIEPTGTSSVAPLATVIGPLEVPRTKAPPGVVKVGSNTRRTPLLMLTGPVKVFTVPQITVLAPFFVMPVLPLIEPVGVTPERLVTAMFLVFALK